MSSKRKSPATPLHGSPPRRRILGGQASGDTSTASSSTSTPPSPLHAQSSRRITSRKRSPSVVAVGGAITPLRMEALRAAYLKKETTFLDLPGELQLRIANEARTSMTKEQRVARQLARRELSLEPLPGVVAGWPLLRLLCTSTKEAVECLVSELDVNCTSFEVDHSLGDNFISLATQSLKAVTSISFESAAHSFRDQVSSYMASIVAAIGPKHFGEVTHLSVASTLCSADDVCTMVRGLPNLESLDVSGCIHVPSSAFEKDEGRASALPQSLREVRLCIAPRPPNIDLTSEDFEDELAQLHRAQDLRFLDHHPNLQVLTLNESSAHFRITGRQVDRICRLTNLRALSLAFCQVSNDRLEQVIKGLMYLEELDLTGNEELSSLRPLTALATEYGSLWFVCLRRCFGVADADRFGGEQEELLAKLRMNQVGAAPRRQPRVAGQVSLGSGGMLLVPPMDRTVITTSVNILLDEREPPKRQLVAMRTLRHLLALERNPPVQDVVESGVLQRVVDVTGELSSNALTFEGTWILTNVASGDTDQVSELVKAGGVELLLTLCETQSRPLADQAVWAIGNVAGDSPKMCALVLERGGLHVLQRLLHRQLDGHHIDRKTTPFINSVWTLGNLLRGMKDTGHDVTEPLAGTVCALLRRLLDRDFHDLTIVSSICWACAYAARVSPTYLELSLQMGIVGTVAMLLAEDAPDGSIVSPALRLLGSVCAGDVTNSDMKRLLDAGLFKGLDRVLDTMPVRSNGVRNALWILSNICAGQPSRAAYLVSVQPSLIDHAAAIITNPEASRSTLAEASYVLANVTVGLDRDQYHPNPSWRDARRVQVMQALFGVLGRVDLAQSGMWRIAVGGLVTFTSIRTDHAVYDPTAPVRLDDDLKRSLILSALLGVVSCSALRQVRGDEPAQVGERKVIKLMEHFIEVLAQHEEEQNGREEGRQQPNDSQQQRATHGE